MKRRIRLPKGWQNRIVTRSYIRTEKVLNWLQMNHPAVYDELFPMPEDFYVDVEYIDYEDDDNAIEESTTAASQT